MESGSKFDPIEAIELVRSDKRVLVFKIRFRSPGRVSEFERDRIRVSIDDHTALIFNHRQLGAVQSLQGRNLEAKVDNRLAPSLSPDLTIVISVPRQVDESESTESALEAG